LSIQNDGLTGNSYFDLTRMFSEKPWRRIADVKPEKQLNNFAALLHPQVVAH